MVQMVIAITWYLRITLAKDRLNEIVNDKDTFDNLNAVVYNGNSIILNAVKRGNKDLSIETLINFKDTTSQDVVRLLWYYW